MDSIEKIFEKFNISGFVTSSVMLADLTTFKIGGPARFVAKPSSAEECTRLFAALKAASLDFYILGGGSNVVMPDQGFDGVIVSTEKLNTISAQPGSPVVEAGSGVMMRDFVEWLYNRRYAGYSFLGGLPGTVGGAVFMNARCYGSEIADILESVTVFDIKTSAVSIIPFNRAEWGYKQSPFQNKNALILSTRFIQTPSVSDAVLAEERRVIDEHITDRTQKGHFSYPSAGSVFKNNRDFGKPSGMLIDEAGGKGLVCGGVRVAPWHGNFIINDGNGTAADVRTLVSRIVQLVQEKSGHTLECEILFVPVAQHDNME